MKEKLFRFILKNSNMIFYIALVSLLIDAILYVFLIKNIYIFLLIWFINVLLVISLIKTSERNNKKNNS